MENGGEWEEAFPNPSVLFKQGGLENAFPEQPSCEPPSADILLDIFFLPSIYG